LAADAQNIVETMGLRREWPNLAFISLAHSYGFSNLILPLLLHGIPLILSGASLPEAVRRATADHPDVTVPAVPVLWRHWLEADAIPPHIRVAISAGAPLPLDLERAIHARLGLKVHNFYGSSECGGIAYDTTGEPRSEAGLAGEPMKGVSLSCSADGCVVVRSQAVGQTYWPEPDPHLRDGVFQTSDLGALREGRLFLQGRAGEQINIAGRKVVPEAIERELGGHPAVRDCVVFGVPGCGHGRGESIVAMVALRTVIPIADLRHHLSDRLPAWQIPREWDLVEALPFNARGKLSRAECRRWWLERRAA
jgi:acyl-CoA synthetase (AMP-forming)/AMP-acid ligase II